MTAELKKTTEQRMQKSIEAYQNNLSKIRTGRAHAGLLDSVSVDYYGSVMPVNQLASITNADARTLVVQPFEAKMATTIEKAIRDADLGLNPSTNGSTIRVPMPIVTEERRRELIKVVKSESEDAKVIIRNIRRDANTELKSNLKNKEISEDEEKKGQEDIQKMTDKYAIEIEKITEAKEKELLTV